MKKRKKLKLYAREELSKTHPDFPASYLLLLQKKKVFRHICRESHPLRASLLSSLCCLRISIVSWQPRGLGLWDLFPRYLGKWGIIKFLQGVTEIVGVMLKYKVTYWNKKGRKQNNFYVSMSCIFSFESVSFLYSPSWPGTIYVDLTALEIMKFRLPLPPKCLG